MESAKIPENVQASGNAFKSSDFGEAQAALINEAFCALEKVCDNFLLELIILWYLL